MRLNHGLFLLLLILSVSGGARGQPPPSAPVKPTRLDPHGDPLPDGALTRLGVARLCHPGACFFAFSPDGKKLATAAPDGTVRIWDVTTGKEMRAFQTWPHKGSYSPSSSILTFSPDGKSLALGCFDTTVRIWEVSTGTEIRCYRSWGTVTAVAFSPDGRSLAFGADGKLHVWDLRGGKEPVAWGDSR